QLIQSLIDEGKLKPADGHEFKGKRITYHDPCYLGRANEVYEAPRKTLEVLDADLVELKRCRSNGLCCGAGGAQRSEEHTSELQSRENLVCRLLLEKKKA